MRVLATSLIFVIGLAACTSPPQELEVDGQNRVIDIVNTADAPVQFYAKNSSRNRAFSARFAEQEIGPNYYQTINFVDGSNSCLFDLFADFENGAQVVALRFNVCKEVSWVVVDGASQ